MKKNIKIFISSWILLLMVTQVSNAQNTKVITSAIPPISSFLNQAFFSNIHVVLQNSQIYFNVRVYGSLERISPSPFTIELIKDASLGAFITMYAPYTLNSAELAKAFENFEEKKLDFRGVSPKDLNENGTYKLPAGIYRICFYAQDLNSSGGTPQFGCANFTICYTAGSAPQFTQPVNNLNINSPVPVLRPVSPVVFSWTPPQSTCGLRGVYNYDFEIREILDNQTITDAINNPYVFRKTSLPSTSFLLDTNLYRNVLQEGKRYAVRVRAVSINTNSPVEIDNNGYSRIEAFQYGGSIAPPEIVHPPEYYFIPFTERKSNFWDDVYTAYTNRKRSDTLVPIKEYIALILTQDGIAYNLDAIELFLALNPELGNVKAVKLSHIPEHPVFPPVTENDRKKFNKEYLMDLEPDPVEENKFKRYLDSLKAITNKQNIPSNSVKIMKDLVVHLDNFNTQVHTVNRVTVNLINNILSELLFQLRINDYNQLQSIFSTLQELTALTPNATSFIYPFPSKKRSSLSSYQSNTPVGYSSQISFLNYEMKLNETGSPEYFLPVIMPEVLPFDVIVWHHSRELPARPVLDAPDLTGVYRVFYTLKKLYNHKNPEINAKTTAQLASTAQVSLPPNSIFKFWTLNMLNHKLTEAVDSELRDVFLNSQKRWPNPKKATIVLKVN